MKVLHLISGGDVGGAKTHVLSLLHGLGKTEQVRLVCFREGEFAEDARKLGIDTVVMEASVQTAIGRLAQMIRAEGFQIVHCHGARANLTGAVLRRKIQVPIVTTVHSDYRLDYLGRPLHRLTYGTINTVALRMFDYHIGVSDAMAQLRAAYPNAMRLDYLPQGEVAHPLDMTQAVRGKPFVELFQDFFTKMNGRPLTVEETVAVKRLREEASKSE